MIMVELIWFCTSNVPSFRHFFLTSRLFPTAILAVLWLAAAAYTTDVFKPVLDLCKVNPRVGILQRMCKDSQVAQAFGFLAFIARKSYRHGT